MKNLNFDNLDIRTAKVNNQHWFLAKDIAAILGLKNPTAMAAAIPNHLKMRVSGNMAQALDNNKMTVQLLLLSPEGLEHMMHRVHGSNRVNSVAWRLRNYLTREVFDPIKFSSFGIKP